MKRNPRYPSVITAQNVAPLARLRAALDGKLIEGKRVPTERAAEEVAKLWAESLLPAEQGSGFEFYKNALLSWLTNKKGTTRRSYIGTLVYFFDFVSRKRSDGGERLRLIAPHQLRQDDVDAYVAHLRRPGLSPEELTDPSERTVFEWMLHELASKEDIMSFEAEKGMAAEGIDPIFPPYVPQRGFLASPKKGYNNFDYIVASLCRKRLLVKEVKPRDRGKEEKSYKIRLAKTKPANEVSTQVQRLAALSSFWVHLLSSNKLGMSRRPSALEPVDPWKEPAAVLLKNKPEDQIRKMARKMSKADLQHAMGRLARQVMKQDDGFVGLRNVLSARDELAVYFFVSTGLRRSEGMMARIENAKPFGQDSGLLLLSGIRKKGRSQDEQVFVPDTVSGLRSRMFDLMEQFVKDTPSYLKHAKASGMDEEQYKMTAKRRGYFESRFSIALKNRDKGPIVPALGRWGNAIGKAAYKGAAEGILMPGDDFVQVPMDGRSLLARMQRLSVKEEQKNKYHPHALRHLSVMLAEGVGDNAALGQAIAGHRSAATTDVYRDMVALQSAAVLKVARELSEMMRLAYEAVPPAAPAGVVEGVPVAEPAQATTAEPEKLATPPEETKEERDKRVKEVFEAAFVLQSVNDSAETMKAAAEMARPQPTEVFSPPAKPPVPKPEGITAVTSGEKAKKPRLVPVERAMNDVPPEVWFLNASYWNNRNPHWRRPVFLTKGQYEGYLKAGKIPGPTALSWFGQDVRDVQTAMMVSSPRTYLPYRMATNRKGEADMTFSETDDLDLADVKKLKRNAAKKQRAGEYRLVALPVVNVKDPGWNRVLIEESDRLYQDTMSSDPPAAKAMVRWMGAILSSSRDASQLPVEWISESHTAYQPGQTTAQAFQGRVREGKAVFRQHLVAEVMEFLQAEGSVYHGAFGKSVRWADQNEAEARADQAVADTIEAISDFNAGKIGTFLRKYDLPEWIVETDDPLGDEKYGLGEADRKSLKAFLRLYLDSTKSMVTFSQDAVSLYEFWDIMSAFVMTEAKTIDLRLSGPKAATLASELDRFEERHGVDAIVACRRFLRHLWEIHKAAGSKFLLKDKKTVRTKEVDGIWGLLWSWVLPSSSSIKKKIVSFKKRPTGQNMASVMSVLESTMSVESIYAPFADMVEDFLAKARMASDKIATLSPDQKGAFLRSMDEYIEEMADEVMEIAKSAGEEGFSFSSMANDLNRIFREVSGRNWQETPFKSFRARPKEEAKKYDEIFSDAMKAGSFIAFLVAQNAGEIISEMMGTKGSDESGKSSVLGAFGSAASQGSKDEHPVELGMEEFGLKKSRRDKMGQDLEDAPDDLNELLAEASSIESQLAEYGYEGFFDKKQADFFSSPFKMGKDEDVKKKAMKLIPALKVQVSTMESALLLKKATIEAKESLADKADDLLEEFSIELMGDEGASRAFIKKAEELLDISRRGGKRPPKKKLTPNKEVEIPRSSFHADPKLIPSLKLLPYIRLSIPTVLFFAYAQPEAARRRR